MTVANAENKLFGEVDLQYVDFSSRAPHKDTYEASSFSQRYAVSYLSENREYMRAPKPLEYTLFMGYEWQALDTTIKTNGITDTSPSVRNGRLFYIGQVDYDPPTMPLNFTAYARDPQRNSTDTPNNTLGESILSPIVATTLTTAGTNLTTGATLTFGEKYGLRRNYGELFKHIPMIKFDYSEEIRRNDQFNAREDSRLRRLAFVSLNKKDNWFHYRTTSFSDYLNPGSNWQRSEYQIGTVDEKMARRWVELTNWITISTDAQFTRMQTESPIANSDEYNLNLFSVASRKAWQLRTFTSFNRRSDYSGISTERRIPLYLSGIWGAETDWSTSVALRDRKYFGLNGNGNLAEEDRTVTLRATTLKRSQFSLAPMISAQHLKTLTGSTLNLSGSIDAISTRRFSSVHDLGLRYEITSRLSSDPTTSEDYVKQTLDGRWSYMVNDRLRMSLLQRVIISTALNDATSGQQDLNSNYDYQQYVTSLNASWTPSAQVSASLMASNDSTRYQGAGTASRQNIVMFLNNKTQVFNSSLSAAVSFESIPAGGGYRRTINLGGSVEYTPLKNFYSVLRGRYNAHKTGMDETSYYELNQSARYDFYPTFYTGRPIFQLEEEFLYNQNSNGAENGWVRFVARYYPYSRVSLAGSTTLNVIGGAQQVHSLSANFNTKYFQTSLDYTYGRRSSDQRIDKRFAATVRRSF